MQAMTDDENICRGGLMLMLGDQYATHVQPFKAAVQEIANEAQKELDVARSDADAARSAGERLRDRIAQLTAACRATASNPDAANAGAPAEAPADLLADVQRRLDEAADGIAGFADKSSAAGKACERSYDALTTRPAGGLGLKR